jgi:hypothetical protein
MLHELQEQQCIGSGKLIALGGFDSRRPTVAAIARRNQLARTPCLRVMRRYLNALPLSQLRSAVIAERCDDL